VLVSVTTKTDITVDISRTNNSVSFFLIIELAKGALGHLSRKKRKLEKNASNNKTQIQTHRK